MSILRKKCKEFLNKTPILFGLNEFKDINIHEFSESSWPHWHPPLEQLFRLDRIELNCWYGKDKKYNTFINNYGIISRGNKIIVLILKDNISDKLEIYCDNDYFEDNQNHKKYVNKFARDNNMSVKKDIFYIDSELLSSWSRPFEVGLDFYEEETQDKITKELFNKLKLEYPELILPSSLEEIKL